ncbi:efflux RND transporter periplasmic adaptor subunit [Billgrantia kenyensis]|uniref:Efflux RND transporter periplasmic adaptor subunit n=1 Tax=Billgrantia kenyensis TaxID=321266 RepID=A0A7V9W0R2_9GAMM|nr:efflux RND transporter periplasmic adaptor subunit [Halomonas kenyensis]MBA2778925.1 efflux RND transporter periplasmic adaptor subunit [Halomonas kenyensis]MCG6662852.1 efflux RND transporter periplasmic adaptor subunit [Halomonas kenyensis]
MKRSAWLIVLLGLVMVGCGRDQADEEEPAVRVVKLQEVGEHTLIPSRRFVGRVEALRTVDLSFRVGGQLVEVPRRQGETIGQGQTVARLDSTDYELAVRRAEAEYQLARREMERARPLLDNNSISQSAFDEIRTHYELAEVQRDSARQDLSYTAIEAPFDALVTRRLVENHSNVQPNTAIVRVQDVTELRVRINVPETLVRHVVSPERFEVEAELLSAPGERFPLEYREHVTEADDVAQTYQVEFAIPDHEAVGAMPGMTAAVSVTLIDVIEHGALHIPAAALDTDNEGNFRVWVYRDEDQRVEPRQVLVGQLHGDTVPVLAGLQRGERIVAAGAHLLYEDARVRPMEATL